MCDIFRVILTAHGSVIMLNVYYATSLYRNGSQKWTVHPKVYAIELSRKILNSKNYLDILENKNRVFYVDTVLAITDYLGTDGQFYF